MSQLNNSAPARTHLVYPETEELEQKLATLHLTGAPAPLALSGALSKFDRTDSTPLIGTEFARGVQIRDILNAENADELLRDLAITGTLHCILAVERLY